MRVHDGKTAVSLFYVLGGFGIAAALTGCLPKLLCRYPGIDGWVVDARSGRAIEGAKVGSVTTDREGRFVLEGEKELGVATTMGGVRRLPSRLFLVKKEGYRTLSCICESLGTAPGCHEVRIAMNPEARKGDGGGQRSAEGALSCQEL